MILLASSIGTSVILVGLTARDRRWPMSLIVACWLPALGAMSARFDPRPELLSLLGVAAYLAVLFRADRAPKLVWLLPFVQAIWVNSHALFVLGPIILGAYLVDRIAVRVRPPFGSSDSGDRAVSRLLHGFGAALAVLAACLVNPYGWRGAIFPLELFPKITAWGGPYKSYVDEFMDLQSFVQHRGPRNGRDRFLLPGGVFLADGVAAFVHRSSGLGSLSAGCRQGGREPAAISTLARRADRRHRR